MAWYLWFIVGLVGGMVMAFVLIMSGTYVIMHSEALQQRVMTRSMRHMMKGAVPSSQPK